MKAAFLATLLVLGACDDDPTIELTVVRGPALDDPTAMAIRELRFDFSGPETFQARRSLPAGLGTEERVRYTPQPGVRGTILLVVSGIGDDASVLSTGSTTIDYAEQALSTRIELGGAPASDLGMPADLSELPDLSASASDWTPLGVFVRQDISPDAGGVIAENGLLEIGEKAVIATSWRNTSKMTLGPIAGTALSFGGPSMSTTYTLSDSSTSFAETSSGGTAACDDCYAVALGGTRPAGHFDVTLSEQLSTVSTAHAWTLHVGGTFDDVDASTPGYLGIETLAHLGAAVSCGAGFCPSSTLSRVTLAEIMARVLYGPAGTLPATGVVAGQGYSCTPGGTSYYTDVSATSPSCAAIHYVRTRGLQIGCSSTMFCPNDDATRILLAIAIAQAYAPLPPAAYSDPSTGRSYSCMSSGPDLHFTDLGTDNAACNAAHYAWARGELDGCTATTYCPNKSPTRAQSADVLSRGLRLSLTGP